MNAKSGSFNAPYQERGMNLLIFGFLPAAELSNMAAVCKAWKDVVDDDTLWEL